MKSVESYYSLFRKEVMGLLPEKSTRVLEIGCGEGRFRENLPEDVEYWGIEPIECVAEIAKKKLDKVIVGKFENVHHELPENYFDTIVCNDVIEHMPDHEEFLRVLPRYLTPVSNIVISVPNVRHFENLFSLLVKKDWEYRESGIRDSTHLRFFTAKSIKRCLSKNNYEILKFKFINEANPRNILTKILLNLTSLIMGNDVKFLQCGILASYKSRL